MLKRQRVKALFDLLERYLSASQIMMLGFATAILMGSVLLSLPVANADGQWLNYVDALFTAATSVCVTGLVTIVPATQFTIFGKIVILILIQFGGFGIIACTMAVFVVLRRQITLRNRVLIQESFNLNTMSGIVKMLRYVVRGTFLVEGIGAIGYAFQFVPQFGLIKGIAFSVFHAVSAFCNAGVDLLGDNSLQNYQLNPWMNFVTITLIIVSGLGFLVWQDLTAWVKVLFQKKYTFREAGRRLHLQTKLAVTMTAVLIAAGTLGFFIFEYSNPDTFGNMNTGQKFMASMFQSVTTRTAGFFTTPQNLFHEHSKVLSCLLMFIGGSPGGTAGGVKTTTVLILFLTCISVLRGKEDTECYRRRISPETIRTGFSVFSVAFLTAIAGTMALVATEGVPLMDALYEVVSSVATVGLSVGLTPLLSTAGKLIIIVIMFIGRIGPVTLALMFAGKNGRKMNSRSLPEEQITVG